MPVWESPAKLALMASHGPLMAFPHSQNPVGKMGRAICLESYKEANGSTQRYPASSDMSSASSAYNLYPSPAPVVVRSGGFDQTLRAMDAHDRALAFARQKRALAQTLM